MKTIDLSMITGISLFLFVLISPLPAQASEYLFSSIIGNLGNAKGQFSSPIGVAFNSTGFIFVVDQNHNRIQIFDPSGNWKQTIGGNGPDTDGPGSAKGQFNRPQGITVNSVGFIFVTDPFNNRIQIFDSAGKWKETIGGNGRDIAGSGSDIGQFLFPTGVAINSTGFLFVADRDNNRIQIFNANPVPPIPEFPISLLVMLIAVASTIVFYRVGSI